MVEETVQPEDSKLEEQEPASEVQSEGTVETSEELLKAKELAENYKIRAEKAERKLKSQPKGDEPTPTSGSDVSPNDIIALSNVHEEDRKRVEKFARDEGVSIAEAVKNQDLQAILQFRTEKRKVAEAANTEGARRGSTKLSSEQIVQRAYSGKEVDPAELAAAEMALKRKQAQQD